MKPKIDWIAKRQAFRTEANRILSNLSPTETAAQPADVLLHELLVHKVELEMQIEELRRAHTELEHERDHYAEFYERAPISYFNLDWDCLIDEVNQTGADLLGMERSNLIHRRFSLFVAPQDRSRWDQVFMVMMNDSGSIDRTLVLEMIRTDNGTYRAYLDCRRLQSVDRAPRFRLALFDISKIAQAESEVLSQLPESTSNDLRS